MRRTANEQRARCAEFKIAALDINAAQQASNLGRLLDFHIAVSLPPVSPACPQHLVSVLQSIICGRGQGQTEDPEGVPSHNEFFFLTASTPSTKAQI